MQQSSAQRNNLIDHLKGLAMLAIMAIHLVDWSNLKLTVFQQGLKEMLYPALFLFVALSGSLIFISAKKYENLWIPTRKLIMRGASLVAVYFIYSLAKLYLYNFNQEPFYGQFSKWGMLDAHHVLNLTAFTAPISILLTIGAFVMVSPIWLWMVRKFRYGNWVVLAIAVFLIWINSHLSIPHTPLFDFLYARNNIMFPLATWLPVFLIGFYLGTAGFEKYRIQLMLVFGMAAVVWAAYLNQSGDSWLPRIHMYPVDAYFTVFGVGLLYLLGNILIWFESRKNLIIQNSLGWLARLGQATLHTYVLHLAIIDLTLLVAYPHAGWIWITVPVGVTTYLFATKKKAGAGAPAVKPQPF